MWNGTIVGLVACLHNNFLFILCAVAPGFEAAYTRSMSVPVGEYDGRLFLPEISTEFGRISVGHVFSLHHAGIQYFVTALHLFGPAGGLKHRIPSDALSASIDRVRLHRVSDDEVVLDNLVPVDTDIGEPLSPAMEKPSASGDIAAFLPDEDLGYDGFQLSDMDPKESDEHSLVGFQRFVAGVGIRKFRFRLIDIDEDRYVYEQIDRVDLSQMSGAPMIDEADNVVSMMVGGVRTRNGAELQFGVPLPDLHRYFDYVEEAM